MTIRYIFVMMSSLAMVASCAGDDGDGGPTPGGGTDAGMPGPGPGPGPGPAGLLCNAANPCPDGQFCFNGVCALGCNSDGDCADNQYCATDDDMLCHNREVSTCPDTPCAEGQMCRQGLCSTPPPSTSCTPGGATDGCERNALCLEDEASDGSTSRACYTFPACDAQGSCPIGLEGALCNNDLIPNKGRICLPGICETTDHCPSGWSCVRTSQAVVGDCSDGRFGAACLSDDDCIPELSCSIVFPGEPGFCSMGIGI